MRLRSLWCVVLAMGALLFTACGGGGGGSSKAPVPGGETWLEIINFSPADGAVDVPVDSVISAEFSQEIDPASINAEFLVADLEGNEVPGELSFEGATVTFSPLSPFAFATTYDVFLKILNIEGVPVGDEYQSRFTTAPDPGPGGGGEPGGTTGETVFKVLSTSPVDGAINVSVESVFSARFSKDLDCASVNASTFLVFDWDEIAIEGTVSCDGATATFTPSNLLAFDVAYDVTLTTGVTDLEGAALAADYDWSFYAASAPDTLPPYVLNLSPAEDADDVPLNSIVAVALSEPVTFPGEILTLWNDDTNTPVAGELVYNETSITFVPNADLEPNTRYHAELGPGITDLAGNVAASYSWRFRTGEALDEEAPAVVGFTPPDGAIGVPARSIISVTFSEVVNPYTVNSLTFDVRDTSGNPVPGNFLRNGTEATFTPISGFGFKTTCVVTLSGIEDTAGNALPDYTSSFTTGMGVVAVKPSPNRRNVGINWNVEVTFSETVIEESVTAGGFLVTAVDGTPVEGTVSFNGPVVTFDPTEDLGIRQTYQVTLTTGIQAVSDGAALPEGYVWSFFTGKRERDHKFNR